MDDAARAELEREIRALFDRGDAAAAATRLMRGYGPEIFAFLVAVHRSESDASESFSDFGEAVWRSLPGFAWESTARTWAYAIARNVTRTRKRNAVRRDRREVHERDSSAAEVVQQVGTETIAFLRTEKKPRLQALRDSLPEADRMLLVLRVDRGLAWNDLARILHETEGEAPLDDGALAREAARLRKRFQLVKDRLRELARKEGLIE